MSRFYVGQRVRLVRPANPSNAGAEGVIVELFAPEEVWGGLANCCVKYDRPVIGSCSHTDQLEPALPPYQPEAEDFASIDGLTDFTIRAPVTVSP